MGVTTSKNPNKSASSSPLVLVVVVVVVAYIHDTISSLCRRSVGVFVVQFAQLVSTGRFPINGQYPMIGENWSL